MMMAMPAAVVARMVVAMMVPAVLVRRDDGGDGAERRKRGSGGRGIVVAIVVAARAGGQCRNSQCNRGRGSNSDCAARRDTHCGFPRSMLSRDWDAGSISSMRCGGSTTRQIMFLQSRSTNVQPKINARSAIAIATIRLDKAMRRHVERDAAAHFSGGALQS
jgi:hypothetical protein